MICSGWVILRILILLSFFLTSLLILTPSNLPKTRSSFVGPRSFFHLRLKSSSKSAEILLLPRHLPSNSSRLVIIVESLPEERDRRDFIRSRFKVDLDRSNATIQLHFLLNWNKTFSEAWISHEDDLIITSLEESYSNLLWKSYAVYAFTHRFVSNPSSWLLKMDSDIVLDLGNVVSELDTLNSTAVNGLPFTNASVEREGKYAVTVDEYPDSTYPPYCLGGFLIIHVQVVGQLLDAAPSVKFLRNEDVFWTGMVAQRAGIGRAMQKDQKLFILWSGFHDLKKSDNPNYCNRLKSLWAAHRGDGKASKSLKEYKDFWGSLANEWASCTA